MENAPCNEARKEFSRCGERRLEGGTSMSGGERLLSASAVCQCGYDGVRKFRDPELRKDGQPSTKVGLMSPGACHTFPSFCSRF